MSNVFSFTGTVGSAPSVTSGQAEMMRLVYELEVRQVELEIQQEELTRAGLSWRRVWVCTLSFMILPRLGI